MSQSTTEFLDRLRRYIQEEASAQYKTLEQQWAHPLHERVAKGWAIEGLSVQGFKDNIIRLTCKTNDSRFREGDLIVLHRGNPQDANALHCDLQYDGENELEASLINGNEYFLSADKDGWIIDQDWFDSSRFYLSALNEAADSNLGRSVVLPLLLEPVMNFTKLER